MNYSEGCKVKTRQSVHQYRAIKTGKLYTLYILDKYRSQEGGGVITHSYMAVPVSCRYDGIFLKCSKKRDAIKGS
jgi:hypothetical protein